jgi:hypothetical protein
VSEHELTEDRFLADVDQHQLTVLHDSGVYRHLRFARPGTMCMHFEIVTFPGYLCYTGDMGAFTFWRVHDMLTFFRGQRRDGHLNINPGYWAQKIEASDKGSGHSEFSPARFREVINEYRVRWIREAARDGSLTKEERRDLWEEVGSEVLGKEDEGHVIAMSAAYDFTWSTGVGHRYDFADLWDNNFERWTVRFLWCCYAIALGIEQYDALTANKVVSPLKAEEPAP